MNFILTLLVFFAGLSSAQSAMTRYEKETLVQYTKETSFQVSAGWSFDETTGKLIAPEPDLIAYFQIVDFKEDPEILSQKAWKSIDPNFQYPVLQKGAPPSKNGWEKTFQIVYDTPAKENKTVMTAMRVFQGKAYIILLDGSNSSLSKRASQLQISIDTWRPSALKKEDLSRKKPKKLTQVQFQELEKFTFKAMKELNIPGASIGVIQDGQVVFKKPFGVRQLGRKEKVTPETLFMIGSTTKPLTTLMLAKLVEQGKIKWDQPIQNVLPSFQLANKETTAQFQIKHTACACTGMPRKDSEFVFGSLSQTPDDILKQLHSMTPTTGFNETFQYSNHLVAVGGYAGAQAYNKGSDLFSKYENVMRDLVFAPLGMTVTRVKPLPSDQNLASPHARGFDGQMTKFTQAIDDFVYPVAPAGSVWSNVDDLSKYVLMELRKGQSPDGKVLFAEDQISKRRSPGVKIDEKSTYGLGLVLETDRGISIIGHGGNTMGFTHDLFFLPEYGVGMIIQANAGSVNGFRNSLRQKLIELLFDSEPKSDQVLDYAKDLYQKMSQSVREKVSVKSKENQWIQSLVGAYENKDLGSIRITKEKSGFFFETNRWKSELATAHEKSGDKLIALISAPWSAGTQLRVSQSPSRKLILDDEQSTYEFTEVKK